MPKMRVVQVSKPGRPFETVEREIPQPGPGQVRVRVEACGICHSDLLTKEGYWPGIEYPRAPGHEIAGVVDAVGPGVSTWRAEERVGIGWYGGHCGHCASCRRGDFMTCQEGSRHITGIGFDGGYAEFVVAPQEALARIPQGLTAVEAAPLMCAGITTFNSLRNSRARAGDLVAVLGLGGLGHLGVQFAARMGFRTVAIARGKDKEPLAKKLGAWRYVDSEAEDPAKALANLGGARLVLATVTSGKAMTATLGGLAANGELLILGASDEPLQIPGTLLLAGRRNVSGWPSGTSIDSEETLAFCELSGVRPMTETYPRARAAEAYERMMSGKARFRVVLTS